MNWQIGTCLLGTRWYKYRSTTFSPVHRPHCIGVWTAPSKSTDRLSMLSSVRELVSVQPDSGVADTWATITWPGAEVACGLSLSLAHCTFMLENRDSCIFELHRGTDKRTDGRTDRRHVDASSRSYCVAVRSANEHSYRCRTIVNERTRSGWF